uniref:Uncharacterized protein n=1 Tax=Panagrolaimus superbus TaxID=310955 RepID=A0A914Y303_9BILA
MSIKEQCEVIAKLIPNVDIDVAHRLVSLVERLRASTDSGIRGISISLSLRRLIYILRRYTQNPDEGIFNAIHRSALSRFMPTITRTAFDKALSEAGIAKAGSSQDDSWKERLLETSKKSSDSVEHESMVPDIVFFDNKQVCFNLNKFRNCI